MSQYYFIVTALPPLILGKEPEMSYKEVIDLLTLNLSLEDRKQLECFQRIADIRNMRALWLAQDLTNKGNLGEKDLQEALLIRDRDFLPFFILDFLETYEPTEDRLRAFSFLSSALYKQHLPFRFLSAYFRLEREIRLTLASMRSHFLGRAFSKEILFEDPADPFVAFLVSNQQSEGVVVPQEYEDLKITFLENRSDPVGLYYALLQYRLDRIEELTLSHPFSVDQVLGYLARLLLVEEWAEFVAKRNIETELVLS